MRIITIGGPTAAIKNSYSDLITAFFHHLFGSVNPPSALGARPAHPEPRTICGKDHSDFSSAANIPGLSGNDAVDARSSAVWLWRRCSAHGHAEFISGV